jgi:predicted dehydrogenase
MGLIARFLGRKESRPLVKTIILGKGVMAGRLAAAYKNCAGIDFLGIRPIGEVDAILGIPGLKAVEIVAEPRERARIAGKCLGAHLFTSLDTPPDREAIEDLNSLAKANNTSVRFRLYPLYYPPYQELKRLLDEDHLGLPVSLKLQVRRGKGTFIPERFDPLEWILEHELGFLALAHWLMGRIEKVYVRHDKRNINKAPGSTLIMWKYSNIHQYGYLQLDFCPELHVRSFTDPVHRFLELTLVGGVIMVTRGEGQLFRMPAILVRGKSTTTSFEMVPDDWREVYNSLPREIHSHLLGRNPLAPTMELATSSIQLVRSAMKSLEQGEEVSLSWGH